MHALACYFNSGQQPDGFTCQRTTSVQILNAVSLECFTLYFSTLFTRNSLWCSPEQSLFTLTLVQRPSFFLALSHYQRSSGLHHTAQQILRVTPVCMGLQTQSDLVSHQGLALPESQSKNKGEKILRKIKVFTTIVLFNAFSFRKIYMFTNSFDQPCWHNQSPCLDLP